MKITREIDRCETNGSGELTTNLLLIHFVRSSLA
jgi:hypothetical protein